MGSFLRARRMELGASALVIVALVCQYFLARSQIANKPVPSGTNGGQAAAPADICDNGLRLGENWYPYETFDGKSFRWVNNDAEIVLGSSDAPRKTLRLDVEAGPGLGNAPVTLQLRTTEGTAVGTASLSGRKEVQFDLPASARAGQVFRLHVEGGGQHIASDPRILNFRVFHCL